jgi:uroporphyrinogen-III decarboxylase
MGLDLEFTTDEGPVIRNPIQEPGCRGGLATAAGGLPGDEARLPALGHTLV